MDILPPDKYCSFWRVLYCGDEIIANDEEDALRIKSEIEEMESENV